MLATWWLTSKASDLRDRDTSDERVRGEGKRGRGKERDRERERERELRWKLQSFITSCYYLLYFVGDTNQP
jgi:hypothetical protein